MERDWPETFPERVRWSRQRAGFKTPTDAAHSLGLRPNTYRTYEILKEEGGREPPLNEIQRIARRFQVSWIWLATGEGRYDEGVLADDRLVELRDKVAQLPKADRDTALDAALSVVNTFVRRIR
ncbi:MAG: helix-turn-helix domain-containing protein [Caulobacteraceae bacterium]